MTKEQKAELREVKRQLRNVGGECSRTIAACHRALKKLERSHLKNVQASWRYLRSETTKIDREERVAAKHADKRSKALRARQAVLEGRLAS